MIIRTYAITIKDSFSGHKLRGEFNAENMRQAIVECSVFYAIELDTTPTEIERSIISVKPIGKEREI